ncbi:MAG: 6,7-dimethyl-8-ribityllumazine synthase [Geminicoccaceae bacterium]
MAGAGAKLEVPHLPGARVLLVEARYYAHINDLLLAGARVTLEAAEVEITHVVVPGALEIPPAIAMAVDSGGFEAFVALGCVIRGETTHFELVAGECCRGLLELGIRNMDAIGNGILTVENEQQALVRADPHDQNKGGGAAHAALSLLDWRRQLAVNAV